MKLLIEVFSTIGLHASTQVNSTIFMLSKKNGMKSIIKSFFLNYRPNCPYFTVLLLVVLQFAMQFMPKPAN